MRVAIHTQIRQAIRVLIHTHISCRLLVEGSAPKPLLNAEFHSAAARSANAFCALCSVLGAWGITLFVTSIAFTNLPNRIAVKLLAKETSPDPFDVTTVVLL